MKIEDNYETKDGELITKITMSKSELRNLCKACRQETREVGPCTHKDCSCYPAMMDIEEDGGSNL